MTDDRTDDFPVSILNDPKNRSINSRLAEHVINFVVLLVACSVATATLFGVALGFMWLATILLATKAGGTIFILAFIALLYRIAYLTSKGIQ